MLSLSLRSALALQRNYRKVCELPTTGALAAKAVPVFPLSMRTMNMKKALLASVILLAIQAQAESVFRRNNGAEPKKHRPAARLRKRRLKRHLRQLRRPHQRRCQRQNHPRRRRKMGSLRRWQNLDLPPARQRPMDRRQPRNRRRLRLCLASRRQPGHRQRIRLHPLPGQKRRGHRERQRKKHRSPWHQSPGRTHRTNRTRNPGALLP